WVPVRARDASRVEGDRQPGAVRSGQLDLHGSVGPGYGVASDESLAAVRTLGRTEGILLDPIYTGKAFAGLLTLAEAGEIEGRVLFWHTGGTPALFCLPNPERLAFG
ncbi:pyridoxal-phosphate dependent enzyme, partial [bacterium]